MSFGEKLRNARKQKNITQEEFAEKLGVSRQAVSKWESDTGFPETEKLSAISDILDVSVDYLINEKSENTDNSLDTVQTADRKIAIKAYDNKCVVLCESVNSAKILFSAKDEPKYILNGVDKAAILGNHTVILGYYSCLEDTEKEISEITAAISRGESSYKLKYNLEVEDKTIGIPKIKNI